MSLRVTQLGAESIATVTNDARLTLAGAEAVEVVVNNARVSTTGAEYLYSIEHNSALITQLGVESVYQTVNNALVTELGAEFVYARAGACTAIIIRPATTADVAAVADAQFIVAAADADLPNARVATNTATVAWDNTTAGQSKASVVAGSIGATELADTAVTPGTYGDATHVPQITVDQDGRITAASDVAITGGGGGAWTMISTTTLGASAASVTFSTIPGTYKDLIVVGQARSSIAATADTLRLQLNGDTAANYDYERENRFGAGDAANAAAFIDVVGVAGSTAPANVADTFEIVIVNYAGTTFHKMVRAYSEVMTAASSGGLFRQTVSGRWRSTAAVTSVTILSPADNLVAGSIFTLYGRA